jgi:cytoskeletal protein CcmA (bactofilin family)
MFSKTERARTDGTGKPQDTTPSLISANLYIVGNLKSEGEIQIDGTVDGDVAAHLLTVGEKAKIAGEVVADEIIVRGLVQGRIRARRVQLSKTARVRGDIWHELLAIDSGAFVEGHCKRTDKPTDTIDTKINVIKSPARTEVAAANAARAQKTAKKPAAVAS